MSNQPDDCSKARALTRRDVLRLAAWSPLALAAPAAEAARPFVQGPIRFRVPSQHETTAGQWRPWLVSSLRDLLPPAPPSRSSATGAAEFRELRALQAQRGDLARQIVQFWDAQGGVPQWSYILLQTIKERRTNPVRAARALALFHTAIADASLAAWHAKFRFGRHQPSLLDPRLAPLSRNDSLLPSYPSEHAAIAAAAATVLEYLYPGGTAVVHGQRMRFSEIANEAGVSRLWAGANYRSDMEAGFRIGSAVGALAVARGESDGSNAPWSAAYQASRPTGPQYWVPTAPGNIFPPLEPMAGTWKTWLLESPGQFRPAPPPALVGSFPSAQFLAETNEVYQTVRNLTPDQLQIARFWADDPGASFTPPGHWAEIATEQVIARQLSTPRAARTLALIGAGVADAAIACWDCKFQYWILRPITAIRTLAGQPFHDPGFLTPVTTPPFPSYTSGHSTFSGCSSAVLAHLFPGGTTRDALGQTVSFEAAAAQAAVSRLYGGIHYTSDNNEGLTCGRQIAEVVIHRAQTDGAP